MQNVPSPEYEAQLQSLLEAQDWEALREFTRANNEIPDEIYEQDQHFWEVLMHKLICNRIQTLPMHEASRAWLDKHGYTTDLGGF